jgi:hypothetical protein
MRRGEDWLAAEAERRRAQQNRISIGGTVLVFIMVPTSTAAYWFAAASDRMNGSTALLVAFVVIGSFWAVVLAATQLNWRCPGCRSPLPTGMGYQPGRVRVCKECGCHLVVNWDELQLDESRPGSLGRQRLRRD